MSGLCILPWLLVYFSQRYVKNSTSANQNNENFISKFLNIVIKTAEGTSQKSVAQHKREAVSPRPFAHPTPSPILPTAKSRKPTPLSYRQRLQPPKHSAEAEAVGPPASLFVQVEEPLARSPPIPIYQNKAKPHPPHIIFANPKFIIHHSSFII